MSESNWRPQARPDAKNLVPAKLGTFEVVGGELRASEQAVHLDEEALGSQESRNRVELVEVEDEAASAPVRDASNDFSARLE